MGWGRSDPRLTRAHGERRRRKRVAQFALEESCLDHRATASPEITPRPRRRGLGRLIGCYRPGSTTSRLPSPPTPPGAHGALGTPAATSPTDLFTCLQDRALHSQRNETEHGGSCGCRPRRPRSKISRRATVLLGEKGPGASGRGALNSALRAGSRGVAQCPRPLELFLLTSRGGEGACVPAHR